MICYTWPEFLNSELPGHTEAAVTIGVFDGVHIGHAELFTAIHSFSRSHGCASIVFTFTDTPKKMTRHIHTKNVQTLQQRLHAISQYGIDYVILIDFTPEFSKIKGELFWKMLTQQIAVRFIAVGHDFKMGYKGSFNAEKIVHFFQQQQPSPAVLITPEIQHEGKRISSSRLREAVVSGGLLEYTKLTGRTYEIELDLLQGNDAVHVLIPPDGRYNATALDSNRNVIWGNKTVLVKNQKVSTGSSNDSIITLQLHHKE
ncbi:hypothetical protein [Spirochaeta dissipatitropha]